MASKRIPLVAGNWKMNFDHLEATYFVQKLVWLLRDAHFDFKRCEVALFPSFTSLRSVQVLVEADKLHVAYGAQSVSVTTQGAFTGDVSADMIAHLGCSYVIVGHSERRKYHPEDDANIVDQVRAVLAAGMQPILCVAKASRNDVKALNSISPWARYETSPAISTKNKPPNSSWPTNLSGPLAPAWWPLRNPPRMPQTPSATI